MVSAVSNAKIHGFVLRFSKTAYPDLPTLTGEKIQSPKAKKTCYPTHSMLVGIVPERH